MMMHDLVYFSGPILHKELVEVLKLVFGTRAFKVQEHMAILEALKSLTRNDDDKLYRSILRKPYFKYKFDTHKLISIYRNYMSKCNPERLYGHSGKNLN